MPDPPTRSLGAAGSLLVPGAVVAGYRLIRKIPGSADPPAWLAKAPGAAETRCVTVQRPTDTVGRQITAHGNIRSPHVLELVDLATDGEGRVVLAFERTDWSLATLLTSRALVGPGEAVTILAPLATGLAAIHHAGFCYDELTPATVRFCSDGRPVLGSLGSLRNPTPAEREEAFRADYRALANLILAVSEVLDEAAGQGFRSVAEWIAEQTRVAPDSGTFLGQVECRLFALAPALPVLLVADHPVPAGHSAGVVGRRGAVSLPSGRGRPEPPSALSRALGRPLTALSALARTGVGGWLHRALRGRATALFLGVVLLVVLLLSGLAVIPESTPTSTPGTEIAKPSGSPVPPPQTRLESTPAAAKNVPMDNASIDGADPVAATVSLLRLRTECAEAASVRCVARYAEPESALAEADSREFQNERPHDDVLLLARGAHPDVQLLQAYGDAVLLQARPANEKRQPVFVLAVRTDTGWRLRDLFEPD